MGFGERKSSFFEKKGGLRGVGIWGGVGKGERGVKRGKKLEK